MRWTIAMVLLLGCAPELPLALGDQCSLNSDCDTPLVCRIGFCRKECTTSRDCAVGLDCVLDNEGLGACQLPAEARCVRDSDCPSGLVCTFGECTNECGCQPDEPCRDCPPGASCMLRDDGTRGCFDPSTQSCVHNSNCAANDQSFVCAPDQRCRVECRADSDCRFGDLCTMVSFDEATGPATGRYCAGALAVPAPDAGTP